MLVDVRQISPFSHPHKHVAKPNVATCYLALAGKNCSTGNSLRLAVRCWGTDVRRSEIISGQTKEFHAKAQSRQARKENKRIGCWEPLRLGAFARNCLFFTPSPACAFCLTRYVEIGQSPSPAKPGVAVSRSVCGPPHAQGRLLRAAWDVLSGKHLNS